MPNWLIGILALVLILRIPSFFEPYYYGDEMIYLTLGQGVRQGMTLYKDVYDNKPPLLYLTAAVAGNLFWFKAILAFWSMATIFIFYKLAEHLFKRNGKIVKIATLIFAILTTIPLLEGNTINAELFMIGPSLLAMLILLKESNNFKNVFLAGILFGISFLFKVPALFDVPVIVFYWIITSNLKTDWKEIVKKTLILGLGFIIPVLLTLVWYFAQGDLMEYIKAAFIQTVGYVSSFRPGDVQKPFLVRNAPLLIRGLIVLVGSVLVFIFRKRLSNKFVLFCLWTLFALFAVALSERPYPHYLIQVVAPMSLLFAMFFAEKSVEQALVVVPLALTFFVPVYYKFWFYPTTSYYEKFINFAIQRTNKDTYLKTFGSNVKRNYEIAEFLVKSSRKTDRVFMLDSDSATVYALAKRLPPIKFVSDYHIYDYSSKSEIAKELANNPPKIIIVTSKSPFSEISPLLRREYLLISQIENANIYSKVGVQSILCGY
jgi:hypothetical protein